ncbi:hypothetical protein QR77_34710 [Streptomyces sp. 150FB]|nr:hypothetical protein QR77_34710 [Streptomyces sp. 150FB]
MVGGSIAGLLAARALSESFERVTVVERDVTGVGVSRPLLEDTIRTRVSRIPGVTLIDRCAVLGLTASADGRRITGVRLREHDEGSAESVVRADLVVDAYAEGLAAPDLAEIVRRRNR